MDLSSVLPLQYLRLWIGFRPYGPMLVCFVFSIIFSGDVWPNILVPCWSHRILKLILEWDCRPCCVYLFYFRSNSDASLIWINLISGNVWNLTSRWLCNLEKALGGDVRMYDGTALIVSLFNQKGAKFMKEPYKQVPTRLFSILAILDFMGANVMSLNMHLLFIFSFWLPCIRCYCCLFHYTLAT